MKKHIILTIALMLSAPLMAQQAQAAEDGFFSGLWGELKSYMPRSKSNVDYSVTATIGVRGAESTESALDPYWQDDLNNDPVFKANLASFEHAQTLCETGKFDNGITEFKGLSEKADNPLIKANTALALAACYDQQGDHAQSQKYLESFVNHYPKHPMAQKAKQVLQASK